MCCQQVSIGSNIKAKVGHLDFLYFWETTYFIGIMCGIGGLILLVVVLFVIFCCCRCHRRKMTPNRDSINLMEKKVDSPARNEYSTLPNGGGSPTNNNNSGN